MRLPWVAGRWNLSRRPGDLRVLEVRGRFLQRVECVQSRLDLSLVEQSRERSSVRTPDAACARRLGRRLRLSSGELRRGLPWEQHPDLSPGDRPARIQPSALRPPTPGRPPTTRALGHTPPQVAAAPCKVADGVDQGGETGGVRGEGAPTRPAASTSRTAVSGGFKLEHNPIEVRLDAPLAPCRGSEVPSDDVVVLSPLLTPGRRGWLGDEQTLALVELDASACVRACASFNTKAGGRVIGSSPTRTGPPSAPASTPVV
ncbi:MAG: hypothetical protein JWM10_280 [Myxococcaceae bacterium]|nr:hypothetical protein [Myxococcaceae bacterium]